METQGLGHLLLLRMAIYMHDILFLSNDVVDFRLLGVRVLKRVGVFVRHRWPAICFFLGLLRGDSLRRHYLSQSFEAGRLQPAGRIRLQCGDGSGFGYLIRTTIIHVDRRQQEHVRFRVCDSRSNCLHNLSVDGLLVVGDQILVQQLLNLVRRQPIEGQCWSVSIAEADLHPTDILNDLDVVQCRLLQLQKLGGLHQVFQLQDTFWHVVTLAPFLDPRDIVIDLQATLP